MCQVAGAKDITIVEALRMESYTAWDMKKWHRRWMSLVDLNDVKP
jgi:hypothetical protein